MWNHLLLHPFHADYILSDFPDYFMESIIFI
jgi:hypothetical protein